MTELIIFLTTVAALTTVGLLVLNVYVDGDERPQPPQSHPEDEFARGAHHRDQIR